MADRATIETMNKVLYNLFGKRSYSKGSIDQIPVGRRQYKDDLAMLSEAGMTEEQFLRLMNFAKVSDTSRKMIRVSDNVRTDQSPIIRNQKEVSKISHAFISEHTRDALIISDKEVQKYNERAVKDIGYFARIKKLMSNPAKLKQVLSESFNNNQPFSGRPIFDKTFKTLGSQIGMVHSGVAHNLKFIEELNRIGKLFDEYRAKVQANRQRGGSSWESVAYMLVGGRSSSPYIASRSLPSKSSQANLTPIRLPSNPAAITQSFAAKFVAEQRRQQAMQQASNVGRSISRSNFLKTLARQNKSSGQASTVDLNFLGSRSTHQPTLFDRLRESKLGRRLGYESTNPVNYKAAGVGLAGGLSYLAMQYAPQAIDALSSGLAHMASGFFARGGSVPGYAYGGDPLRNIHLTKSPESASKLIGSNVVNSLQSDANSTGLYGLLQSMIKSGSTDASFRGLFYRKGLDANTWMEKVHQMKLQSADTFMNGYFAQGGVPRYAKGTSDEIPFNFKHFSIGRNSKFIKQMFDLSAPYKNDSDGQYQMFRAIENKKMEPKEFGLLAATLKDMSPISALSYQSDGSGIEMTDLGTHPKFQKQGFGQILLAEMLNIGKDKGLDLATWSANSDAAAGYYNYLGAKEGENKSFTFDLNEWTGKFVKRRAFGGDTFPQQLALGPNSQLSADAIKRLQLLRIRAQAGQRLADLRDQAQLNMQLGNTSLFRSPNTAAGVINARVLRNLESRFSGQKGQKFATGGSIPRFDGGGDPFNGLGNLKRFEPTLNKINLNVLNDVLSQFMQPKAKNSGAYTEGSVHWARNLVSPLFGDNFKNYKGIGQGFLFNGKDISMLNLWRNRKDELNPEQGFFNRVANVMATRHAIMKSVLPQKKYGFEWGKLRAGYYDDNQFRINWDSSKNRNLSFETPNQRFTPYYRLRELGDKLQNIDIPDLFKQRYDPRKIFAGLYNKKKNYSFNVGDSKVWSLLHTPESSYLQDLATSAHQSVKNLGFNDFSMLKKLNLVKDMDYGSGYYNPIDKEAGVDYSKLLSGNLFDSKSREEAQLLNSLRHEMIHGALQSYQRDKSHPLHYKNIYEKYPKTIAGIKEGLGYLGRGTQKSNKRWMEEFMANFGAAYTPGMNASEYRTALLESGVIRDISSKSFRSADLGMALFSKLVGQKVKKHATGGSTLNNPIRVSDGELAITRGMVDKIGLSTLRRINAGDMSGLQGFSAGGMFEFDGPGTGTSDSILTDADRGPKGQDASDIGFIIRRTSSDRLKSIVGRAMGGIIPGYAEGDQPMDNYGNVIPASLLQKPSIDFIRERFKQYEGVKYIGKKTVFPAVTKALESIKEFTNINDLLDVVMQAVDSTNVIHESSKSVGGKISPYERALRNSRSALSEAFSDIYNQFDPAAVTDLQESEARNKKSLDDQTDAINDVTEAERRREKAINDAIKSITDQQGGMYRGNVRYVRHGEFGENDLRYIGDDAPSRTELTSEQDRLGAPRKEPGSISSWYIRNIKGLGQNIGREMFNPTEQQIGFQTQIKMPIFMENTPNQQVQDHLDKSFKEFINFDSIVKQVLHEEFGKYIGGRNIDDIVKVSSTTEDGMVEIPLGTHGELYEKSQKTYDGISVGAANDPKNIRDASELETRRTKQTLGVVTVEFEPPMKELEKIGGFNTAEVMNRVIQRITPQTGALTQKMGGKDIDVVKGPTVITRVMSELAQKTSMTNTGLYKMGDLLRGISWRFASLSMSSMGVYFSIQGLMMTFQQGLGAITTPLADIEALFKNIGMSSAFGLEKSIFNAKSAMDKLRISQRDFIDGWKNLTNIQGTIQTLFASIGTKIFGGEKGRKFTDNLLKGISDAFRDLEDGGISDTIRELLGSIVKALPAILPAIQSITTMLKFIADNPALVAMGAQLMVISLILQPIMSGLAAIVTVGGGFATITNLLLGTSKALWAVSITSKAAGAGFAFAATRAGALTVGILGVTSALAGLFIAYEAIANIVNLMTGEDGFKMFTFTGLLMNQVMPKQGFASGGEIVGTATAAIDDKTINVEEGEFVVRKDVAQRNKKQLIQFNQTGVWPGSQKMAEGGFLGPSMGANVSAVESTYQFNKTATLMEDGNRYGYNTQQVLTDVQNGDALNVFVKNMPDSWGNGSGNQQIPFDIGYPYRENINPTMFQPNFKGFIPNPVVDNTQGITPTWDRDTTGIINPDVNVAPDKNVNLNEQPNPNAQGTNQNTTGITPTSSALNYIGQIINQAFDQVVEAFQGAVDGIVEGFFAVMEAAHSAAESIANFAGAIGKSLGNMSAKPLVDLFKGGNDNEGTVTAGGLGFRASSSGWLGGLRQSDYEDLLYQHGGYTKYGDKTNYLEQSTKRSGIIDQYRNGRILPPGALPDGEFGPASRMREIWPTKQLIRKDFPYDYGEVGRALTTGDPYQVALAGASATASNAIVGGVGKGLQYGALRMGGTLTGGALARAGAGFSQMNMLGGNPLVFAGAHYLEAGQAFDEFMEDRSTEDLKTGEFNAVTGALTGGFSTAGFGKGMDVWGSLFGLDETQMRERLKANEGLMNFGLKDINPFLLPGRAIAALQGKDFNEEWDSSWDKLKGGNRAVSDILESASFKVGDFDIGKGAGDIASAVNKGVFDAIQQAMNLDVGTIFGAGTSTIGIGAGLVETAGNTAQMAMENPFSMAQLGITAGVPLIGPFLAAMGMPQTTDWITNTKGYGSQDVTPDTWREAISDPLINQLPAAFTTANEPVVTGLDTVNQSIIAGNESTVSAIKGINIQVQPTIPTTTPAFANGGIIGGKSTSTIDDKLIAGEEGEFIVRKDVAQKYGAQLHALNSTGKWPKGYGIGGFIDNISNDIVGGSFLQAPVQIKKSLASNTEFIRLLKETVKYSKELSANAHKINPTSTLKIDMSKVVKPTGGLIERGLMDNAGSLVGKFLPFLPKMIMGGVASAIMMADPVGKGQNQKGSEASQGGSILNPYWFTDMGNLKTLPEVTKTENEDIVSAIKTNADKQFDAMMRYNEVVGQIARYENGNYTQRSAGFEKQYKEHQIDALVKYAQELTAIGDASYSDEITNIYKQIATLAPDQSVQIQKAMEIAKQFGPTSSNKGYVYMQNFKRDESEYNQWGTGDVWAGIPNRFGGNSGMSISNLGMINSNGMPWWSVNTDLMHGTYSDAQKSLNDVYIGKYGNYITDPNGNKYSMGGGSVDTSVSKYYGDYNKTHPSPEYIGEVPKWSEGGISVDSILLGKMNESKDLSMVQSPASGYLNQQQTITQTQPITVQISVSGDELATKGYVEKIIEVQVPRIMANNRSPTVGNY